MDTDRWSDNCLINETANHEFYEKGYKKGRSDRERKHEIKLNRLIQKVEDLVDTPGYEDKDYIPPSSLTFKDMRVIAEYLRIIKQMENIIDD